MNNELEKIHLDSDEVVLDYIRRKTENKFIKDKQVKITANDMLRDLNYNEATVHANIKRIHKRDDFNWDTLKRTIMKKGKEHTFYENRYWIGEK